jgi:hypothetical protein
MPHCAIARAAAFPRAGEAPGRGSGRPGGEIAIARAYALLARSPPYRRSRPHPRPVTLDFRALDFCDGVDRLATWATDQAPIRVQRRGMPIMKFWLLRPKGFNYHYTDTESCWGCVVRAPDRETALALGATSELRLGDDFPDGWDVTEVPVDGPPAVIMFDY